VTALRMKRSGMRRAASGAMAAAVFQRDRLAVLFPEKNHGLI